MKKIIISFFICVISLLCLTSCGSDMEFKDENFKRIVATALDTTPDKLTKEELTGIEEVIIYKGSYTDYDTMMRTRETTISICLNGFRDVQKKYNEDTTGTAEDPENYIYREKVDNFIGYEDITNFKALKAFYLSSDYSYEDINPLKYLTQIPTLKQVTIGNYNIYDISAIGTMPNLEELSLGGNIDDPTQQIKSLEPLKRLSNLKVLAFSNIIIPDTTLIGEFKNLENLSLAKCGIKNISSLSKLDKLTYLNLNNNSIKDITPISKLKELKIVYLDYNQIEDVSSLANLNTDNLEFISLEMNNFSEYLSLKPLGDKVNLGFTPIWKYEN